MTKHNPKFNTSRDGTWWPIKQYRFETNNHPVVIDKAPKNKEVQMKVSHNEKQIIEGLANILMCKPSVALRVALQEHGRVKGDVHTHEAFLPAIHAKKSTKRSQNLKARVTQAEAELAARLAAEWNVKASDVVRICCIELARLIRADRITSIKGCKRLTQIECIKIWGAANKDRPKGSKLTALTTAAQKALNLAEDKQFEDFQFWGECIKHANETGMAEQFTHTEYYNGNTVNEYFDFESFKVWYVDTQLDGGDGDANYKEAIANPDKDAAIKALAQQYALWCEDGSDWKEFIAQATEDYETEHEVLSDEDVEESEAWLENMFPSNAVNDNAGPIDFISFG